MPMVPVSVATAPLSEGWPAGTILVSTCAARLWYGWEFRPDGSIRAPLTDWPIHVWHEYVFSVVSDGPGSYMVWNPNGYNSMLQIASWRGPCDPGPNPPIARFDPPPDPQILLDIREMLLNPEPPTRREQVQLAVIRAALRLTGRG